MNLINYKENNDFEELIPSFKSKGMNLGLDRIQNALQKMGNPCHKVPAIQIAGTNGKGSITCFLESCLTKTHIKTGCTTSPHLVSWCERIRIDGQMISPEKLRKFVNEVKLITKSEQLTPFELVIASAFNYFFVNQVELILLEVGLGGRLDATTAHPWRPIIAMGKISFDHCEYLGESLAKITKEKAAVISYGSHVISADQEPEVKKILEDTVLKKNAKISWVSPLSKQWELGIAGEIQRENAAVAKAVLESLPTFGWKINNNQIKKGLASANWPGRLQSTKWEGLPLILDGAHNPEAIRQLSKERALWVNQSSIVHWIIGIQTNKNAPEMLRNLLKEKDIAWIVQIPNHQSWSKDQLLKACPELSHQLRKAESILKVLELLRSNNQWPTPPPIVTGSLYLIGDLIKNKIIT
ncbi:MULTISPECIES: bifunctional folylpolyglutamate synthase/dihydrofolate synthase [Prochlorococcus]|uniref:Folylpolyglutamate synthase n=1 Tax=Prochlorococcus marinus (strain SARG / CCMP1375 / SS120) TaxID=167539 RepID=Q7VAS8_PROMA|nr:MULTISPECIES: Mur ligase family protein [Prochlorococcus]AAQ00420.1 Folylpolyglutamate synthase [Prochlorococcus marinus subsp. marinus str. CCMP1375]KGG14303.1 Dihydrofolate synthase [Prochlorococcus marinus str. LG]KGG22125.1 Dihydrofolate synthase [Prochlorococcus marinus str. SS2]KGG24558.1 Dihydrofolate synthase [Prochlorococcus marinus str. SS35]KGG33452.1 Dihydrofolate synthase [Prochlorococcus marinus str. SS51]